MWIGNIGAWSDDNGWTNGSPDLATYIHVCSGSLTVSTPERYTHATEVVLCDAEASAAATALAVGAMCA